MQKLASATNQAFDEATYRKNRSDAIAAMELEALNIKKWRKISAVIFGGISILCYVLILFTNSPEITIYNYMVVPLVAIVVGSVVGYWYGDRLSVFFE